MILNTGSRTDIPAYYSKWFMNRVHEGFVYARNPYYYRQVIRYEINPEVVDVIVFCTKNPIPMLEYIDELRKFNMFWFVTITPYGKEIEPNVPDKNKVIEAFKKLSTMLGSNCVSLRYDPILIDDKYTLDYHIDYFEKMMEELDGYTNQVVISFIDLYEKTKRNFPEAKEVDIDTQIGITKKFVEIGKRHNIEIFTCHENEILGEYGANISGCMTKEVLEKAINNKLNVKNKLDTRQGCNCLLGNDIGAYNTCGHLCRYCYANYSKEKVIENMKRHDPDSPLLIGNIEKDDVVRQSRQISYLDKQLSLF